MKSRQLRLSLVMMLSSCSLGILPNGTQQSRHLQQASSGINSEYYASLQGRLTLMRRCEASVVFVDRIYLTCDSPGDYYYGSGGYRKSSRCKYGDKANMYIFFTISQDYGWYGIDVTIDAGVLNSFVNVQPRTDLCSLETMTYLPSASDMTDGVGNAMYCPTPGNYQLYWSFTVPKGGGDAQLQYTPDFRLKFYSTTTSTTLGCAGTGTKATVQQAELHKKEGEIALGAALATLFGIFAVCLCMAYRRKKQLELVEDDLWQRKRLYMARSPVSEEALSIDEDGNYDRSAVSDPSQRYELQERQYSEDHDEYLHERHQQQQTPSEQDSRAGEGYSQHRSDYSITSSLPYSIDPSSLASDLPNNNCWVPPPASDVPSSIHRY